MARPSTPSAALALSMAALVGGLYYVGYSKYRETLPPESDLDTTLMSKHSVIKSYHVDRFLYTLRIVYVKRSKAERLPQLPLMVFIHGLGGQANQFADLLNYFNNLTTVLTIDLPGCGKSAFSPSDWEAYTTSALVALVETIIKDFTTDGQKVVLVGHSMGTQIVGSLGQRLHNCAGAVLISPIASMGPERAAMLNRILQLPEVVFNVGRFLDRLGGIDSKSVDRMVNPNAPVNVKRKQLFWNYTSQTKVWRRMVRGFQVLGQNDWGNIKCPVLLIAGTADRVCSISEMHTLTAWLTDRSKKVDSVEVEGAGHAVMIEHKEAVEDTINTFLIANVDATLDLSWQLARLADDKWSLKNEAKWKSVDPVSLPVGPFRAMKTLRETDAIHTPATLKSRVPQIEHVVDISHDIDPPYDPSHLAPIQYHKMSTVSKIPPTTEEVSVFISLVDDIIDGDPNEVEGAVAVHCHYGFNRTGFFICTYLVERCDYDVRTAIEKFRLARPPGIKHAHFINTLVTRYT